MCVYIFLSKFLNKFYASIFLQDNCKLTDPVEARRAEQFLSRFRNYINSVKVCNKQVIYVSNFMY